MLNQSINFTVTVSAAAPGGGTPTGTVQFTLDGKNFGTPVTLVNGSATSGSISTLKLGSHTITASYSGDPNFTATTAPSFTQVVNLDNTTTSLVVTVNPSVYGQSISFTASVAAVAPGTGTPTGSVTFTDGSTTLGKVTLAGGTATYKTTKLATGDDAITATYNGSSTFATSSSPILDQVVNQDASTTVVTTTASPSVYGQSVTLTATVSAAGPGSGTPTGTVIFYDGTTALDTATLSGGKASFKTTALAVGSHAITAVYSGDVNFTTSTSATLDQIVNQDGTATTVSSSVDPSVFGQSVTLTAKVSAASPGSGTPTGSVTFYDGTTALDTATLTSGKATFKTNALAVGSQSITAVYSGDGNFTTSTSSALTQTVNQDGTTTKLKSSDSSSVYGESVTFTATVKAASPGSGTPTGPVSFLDGTTTLGTGILDGTGTATFTTLGLSVVRHTITAVYSGDDNFLTSTSAAVNQGVNPASTKTNVASSANPSTSGQSVTFTATIAVVAPGSGSPTGTVTFKDGSTLLGTGSLSDGTASFTIATLAVGTHSITAVYSGDGNFTSSTSSVLKQVVKASQALTVSSATLVDLALGALGDDASDGGILPDTVLKIVSAIKRRRHPFLAD